MTGATYSLPREWFQSVRRGTVRRQAVALAPLCLHPPAREAAGGVIRDAVPSSAQARCGRRTDVRDRLGRVERALIELRTDIRRIQAERAVSLGVVRRSPAAR